ncbi:hypothetical protein MMC22_010364 [Lobaria immixta]|nr:hypothetical protein [Lobaria immixta]
MSFTSLTAALFLLKTVASLAAVDPNPLVLNNLAPNPSLNDASDSSMTSKASVDKPPANDAINSLSPPTADVTTFANDVFRTNDLVASGTAVGTGDPAGATYSGGDQISNGASNECLTDQPNARKRVRRGCITLPTIQQNPTKVEGTRKPEKKMTGEPVVPEEPELVRPFYIDTPTSPAPTPEPSNSEFKVPEADYNMCDRDTYGPLNIPMCDSGFGKMDGFPLSFGSDIYWFTRSIYAYADLYFAHAWVPGYGCRKGSIAWCCFEVSMERPDLNVLPDLYRIALFRASICVVWNGRGEGLIRERFPIIPPRV